MYHIRSYVTAGLHDSTSESSFKVRFEAHISDTTSTLSAIRQFANVSPDVEVCLLLPPEPEPFSQVIARFWHCQESSKTPHHRNYLHFVPWSFMACVLVNFVSLFVRRLRCDTFNPPSLPLTNPARCQTSSEKLKRLPSFFRLITLKSQQMPPDAWTHLQRRGAGCVLYLFTIPHPGAQRLMDKKWQAIRRIWMHNWFRA